MQISVCIPVYNRKDMILRAVESALKQDVEGLEIIICDNASDDGTFEIISKISDRRVRVIRNEHNIGMVNNFTKAFDVASGEFIILLCSDDELSPGFLQKALDLMRSHETVTILSSVGQFVDGSGRVLSYNCKSVPPGIFKGPGVHKAFFEYMGRYKASIFNYPAGIVVRRSAYQESAPFAVEVGDPCDADMWIRCLRFGDFLVTDFEGCKITRHQQQRGLEGFKNGRYFRELVGMAERHLKAPDERPLKQRFLRRLGGIAFPWAIGSALRGDLAPLRMTRSFGWTIGSMLVGFIERGVFRVLAKLGQVRIVGLERKSG